MQIFVKSIDGQTITINDVEKTDTIEDIKKKFMKKKNILLKYRDYLLIVNYLKITKT